MTDRTDRIMGAVALLILLFVGVLATLQCGCTPQGRPECADDALVRIEAAYMAEIFRACDGQSFDTCDARPEIDARYDALREEWIQCKP